MNGTTVTSPALNRLTEGLSDLAPELRKAATYVLENPNIVGVTSVREIARSAKVNPNTMVRMARHIGFEGYEDFRETFRETIRSGGAELPDRARWLQSISQSGQLGALYAEMIASTLSNIESTFLNTSLDDLSRAASLILSARHTYVLGVGVNASNAANFAYLARTALDNFTAIPRHGGTPLDDLAGADERDVLIAMTFRPFREEVVSAVEVAREQGVRTIGISDSPASPIVIGADQGFTVAVDTPQFFPSSAAGIALLEILLSFVIANADDSVVDRVHKFHKRRHALGIYREEDR